MWSKVTCLRKEHGVRVSDALLANCYKMVQLFSHGVVALGSGFHGSRAYTIQNVRIYVVTKSRNPLNSLEDAVFLDSFLWKRSVLRDQ